jgi:hypothetical protein
MMNLRLTDPVLHHRWGGGSELRFKWWTLQASGSDLKGGSPGDYSHADSPSLSSLVVVSISDHHLHTHNSPPFFPADISALGSFSFGFAFAFF